MHSIGEHVIRISVNDNGRGIATTLTPAGDGIDNMSARPQPWRHAERRAVRRRAGGTRVLLEIPLGKPRKAALPQAS